MIKPGDEPECYKSDAVIVKPVKEEDMKLLIVTGKQIGRAHV